MDGQVFGVLNVEANLDYSLLGLEADPEVHVQDYHVPTELGVTLLLVAIDVAGAAFS